MYIEVRHSLQRYCVQFKCGERGGGTVRGEEEGWKRGGGSGGGTGDEGAQGSGKKLKEDQLLGELTVLN